MKLTIAFLFLAVACASRYTRTKSIEGHKYSALVEGKVDDAARVELDRRARESCGGHEGFELFCHHPTAAGTVVYWTCAAPKILPPCPPPGS